MGSLEYWQPEGFPMAFFPYEEKRNFRPPLLMLRIQRQMSSLTSGVKSMRQPSTPQWRNATKILLAFEWLLWSHIAEGPQTIPRLIQIWTILPCIIYTSELYLNEAFIFFIVPFNTVSYERALPVNFTEAAPLTSTPRDYLENITVLEVTIISNSSHSSAEINDINNDMIILIKCGYTF